LFVVYGLLLKIAETYLRVPIAKGDLGKEGLGDLVKMGLMLKKISPRPTPPPIREIRFNSCDS